MKIPTLIAHRGYPKDFPENSLEGVQAALDVGACYIEVDIQFSADGVPVLFHDGRLKRTAGVSGTVTGTPLEQLQTLPLTENGRLGKRAQDIRIPTLVDLVAAIQAAPQCTVFVELKKESLKKFRTEIVVKKILDILDPVLHRCVIISYEFLAIQCARALGAQAIGWVLQTCNEEIRSSASKFAPDYLFCNYTKIGAANKGLWPGPWQWALYEVAEPELALKLANRGADLIETMAVGEMLQHPLLSQRGCIAN